jgi:hypothetical protein
MAVTVCAAAFTSTLTISGGCAYAASIGSRTATATAIARRSGMLFGFKTVVMIDASSGCCSKRNNGAQAQQDRKCSGSNAFRAQSKFGSGGDVSRPAPTAAQFRD